ncbi:hypothetical protein GGF46_003456 [Coemansia sp. RSA 552]|nr:hypothetical protein GGF46_003456 [Coemansia sp. RSA 552]
MSDAGYPYAEGGYTLYSNAQCGYTLYSNAQCPYAQRALRAFNAAGVDYQVVEIDLQNKPEWFSKVNPQQKVPTLRTPDGTLLVESLVIAEYVADQFPQAKLLSTDALERAQLRLFIELFSSKFTPYIYRLLTTANKEEQETHKKSMLEGVRLVSQELERQWKRDSGKGGSFWYGTRWSFAEIATASFISNGLATSAHYRGFTIPKTEEYAAFNRWYQEIQKAPQFIEVKPQDAKVIASYKKFVPDA